MNYFYLENDNYIIGFSRTNDPEKIKVYVPEGIPFYFYKKGDDLKNIVDTQEPAAIGVGKKIDY